MGIVDRLNKMFVSFWFGEVLLLVICAGCVIAAGILSPTPEAVSLFGMDVPVMCSFREATGYNCPGCGLTRSFSFMAHLAPVDAFKMNPIGPFAFLLVLTQVPYRIYRLVVGPSHPALKQALSD